MVDVNAQNKIISVNVSSSGVSSNVNASGDTSHYYSEKAREWAISNRIVDGVDYSSKYYAGMANQSALNAQSFAQSAQDSYNNFQNSVDGALSNIDSSVQGAIDDINNIKTDTITDIEFVADGAKEEIEDLVDTGKDELKEAIGDVKILTTLEIGDIGIAPLGIDETQGKRRYLNGQLIIQEQYVQFTNKVKSAVALYPSLACSEADWQATALLTVGGQVGNFVVDDEAGTIRLPKIIMPIQGLTDLSKLGEIVEAGLPNITGNINSNQNTGFLNQTVSGAFGVSNITEVNYLTGLSGNSNRLDFDASRSNAIYGNSNTVQQEQIQYPYFIQVATGSAYQENITNEIELNNPFVLLEGHYFAAPVYNSSWLQSNAGFTGSLALQPTAYNALLVEQNPNVEVGTTVDNYTKRGLSVKLDTEAYTDYDFVLNTTSQTFRCPLKINKASGRAVVGNGMTLGLTDGTNNASLRYYYGISEKYLTTNINEFGNDVGTNNWTNNVQLNDGTLGLTTDPTKSGLELSDSDLYLYFYVGETVQNANLINAGRIEEKIDSLIPDNSSLIAGYGMPSTKYIDLTLGASGSTYTAPANGYFYINKVAGSDWYYVRMRNAISDIDLFVDGYRTSPLTSVIPAKKGDIVYVYYNATGTTNDFRFIYAQGESEE